MPESRPVNRSAHVVRKKKKRNPFRLSLILMFYVVSVVVSFVMHATKYDISSKPSATYSGGQPQEQSSLPVFEGDSEEVYDEDGSIPAGINENTEVSDRVNPVPESDAVPESYLNSCMFIGDSITTGFSVYKVVPTDTVMADVGLRIDNIEEQKIKSTKFTDPVTVMTALEQVRPENVYILLGSNGVAWYNNDSMIEAYGNFVDNIKTKLPDSKVYIISLTPVGKMKENIDTIENGKVLNSEIDRFNQRLLDLADKKNVYYLDVNSELKDDSGKLPDDVTRDGMHFTAEVYKTFVRYILTHTAK